MTTANVIHDAADHDALRKCPVGTRIQTLIFERDQFSQSEASSWARRHGFKAPEADVKTDTIRLRQESPGDFIEGSFRTIRLREGVKAVIGCPKPSAREDILGTTDKFYVSGPPNAKKSDQRWAVLNNRGIVIARGLTHAQANREATRLEKLEAQEDHVHAMPAGVTGGAVQVKEEACACSPQPAAPRSAAYEACLAEGAKLGPMRTPTRVYELLSPAMAKEEQETLVVVPLDARYQLRGAPVEVHRGAASSVAVSTAQVLRAVAVSGATSYVVAHNHPSGKCSPSRADLALHKHLDKATKTVYGQEVLMLDHIIVGRKQFYSMRENKLHKVG